MLLPVRQFLRFPGPVVCGRQRSAWVVIHRGHRSERASVLWSARDLRHCGHPAAYRLFRSRLEEAGMCSTIDRWLELHADGLGDPLPQRRGGPCCGGVRHLPLELADILASHVCGYYEHAMTEEAPACAR